jgi:hypothetical protein
MSSISVMIPGLVFKDSNIESRINQNRLMHELGEAHRLISCAKDRVSLSISRSGILSITALRTTYL